MARKSIYDNPRYRLALQMMQGNQQSGKSVGQGLASLAQSLAGAYFANRLENEEKQRSEADRALENQAFLVASGKQGIKPERQEDGSFINWNDPQGETGFLAAASMLPEGSELRERFMREYSTQENDRRGLAQSLALADMRFNNESRLLDMRLQKEKELSDQEAAKPRKLSSNEQKEFFEASDAASAAEQALGLYERAQQLKNYVDPVELERLTAEGKAPPLGEGIYSGLTSPIATLSAKLPVADMFVDQEKAARTTAYNNLLSQQALSQLKSTFPGAISNAEREALEKLQAISDYSPEQQELILQEGIRSLQAVRDRAKAKKKGIVSGDIYSIQLDDDRARLERLRALKNQTDNAGIMLDADGGM